MNEIGLYSGLTERINQSFDFEKILEGAITKEAQIDAIKNLPLPESFKDILLTNNNPEMFKLLDVSNFTDYISGTLASIVVKIIVFIVLFIIIWILLTMLVNVINLIAKLPGLNEVNKFAGAGLGLLLGLAFIFIGFSLMSLIISTNHSPDMVALIEESRIGLFLYNNNPMMDLLNNNIGNNYFWKIIAG